jgi:hypothetical protein
MSADDYLKKAERLRSQIAELSQQQQEAKKQLAKVNVLARNRKNAVLRKERNRALSLWGIALEAVVKGDPAYADRLEKLLTEKLTREIDRTSALTYLERLKGRLAAEKTPA